MQFHDQETLNSMPDERLKEYMVEVCVERERCAVLLRTLQSPLGQAMLDRARVRLTGILERYSKLPVIGVSDRDVIVKLAELQCSEKLVKAEIAEMEGVKDDANMLDAQHDLCNNVIHTRDRSVRTSR